MITNTTLINVTNSILLAINLGSENLSTKGEELVFNKLLLYFFYPVNNVRPECRGAAFIDDDKYLSCHLNSSIEPEITDCLNSSVSEALSMGARVMWCISDNNSTCLNDTSVYTFSNTGVLHISSVTMNMKDYVISCSFQDTQGELCEPSSILQKLSIYTPGTYNI